MVRWWVQLDDGGRVVADPREGLHPLIEEAAHGRGVRLAIGVAKQTLHGISPRLHAHLGGIKVLLQTADATDAVRMGSAMGLTREQIEWAQAHLRPGLAVMQVAGAWPEPFVARIAPLELEPVSEAEVLASSAVLRALPVEWAEESRPVIVAPSSPSAPPPPDELDALSRRYLAAVAQYPGKPSTYIAKVANIKSGQRAAAIRHTLEDRGLIQTHVVATNVTGRSAILVELTDAGRAALADAPQDAQS